MNAALDVLRLFQHKSCLAIFGACCEWCLLGCFDSELEEIHPIPAVSAVGLLPRDTASGQTLGTSSEQESPVNTVVISSTPDAQYLTVKENNSEQEYPLASQRNLQSQMFNSTHPS